MKRIKKHHWLIITILAFIALVLVIILLLAGFNQVSTSQPTKSPTKTTSAVQQNLTHLTVQDIQSLLDRTSISIPDDAALGISIYNEAHKPIGLSFTIKGKKAYSGMSDGVEGILWIGTWYEEKVRQSSDLCSLMSQMKADQNVDFKSKINVFSLMWKYGSLKSCLGF